MATELQRNRLRADLSANRNALPDPEVDDLFLRATDQYGTNLAAVEAQARLLGIRQLKAAAAKRTDYTKNQSSERLSQWFTNLDRLTADYRLDLKTALDGDSNLPQWGGLRRVPRRDQEYPDA